MRLRIREIVYPHCSFHFLGKRKNASSRFLRTGCSINEVNAVIIEKLDEARKASVMLFLAADMRLSAAGIFPAALWRLDGDEHETRNRHGWSTWTSGRGSSVSRSESVPPRSPKLLRLPLHRPEILVKPGKGQSGAFLLGDRMPGLEQDVAFVRFGRSQQLEHRLL